MKSSIMSLASCLVLAVLIFTLTGCGGGGGGGVVLASTVSGVAASGAPLIGQVSLIDANGTMAAGSPMMLNSDGSFMFNVFGLTPPFILKAEGVVGRVSVTMYSVAMGRGTANINPMSNIVVAAAAGVNDPALVFTNPVTNAPKITSTTFNKAITDMQTMMAPVLTPFNATGMNPVTGSYAANHTGLDAVFDVVQMPINTSAGTMSVFDKTSGTTGATIGSAFMSQMATPTQPITQIPSTAVPTDLQNITTMLGSMGTVLNKGANITTADLAPFLVPDPAFGINGGMTATQFMTFIQTSMPALLAQGPITQMSNVTFDGNSAVVGGGYKISFAVRFADGSITMSNMTFSDEMVVAKNASAWQLKGNGHRSLMLNSMQTQKWQLAATTQTEAGLSFNMIDAGTAFKSAVATGPGLPSPGGVMFIKGSTPTTFVMSTADATLPSMGSQFFKMPDTTVSAIPDNAPFTFSFYSSLPPRNNPMEQRTMTFPKRCFTRAEAASTTGLLPTVTPAGNMATHSFSTMMGNMMGGMMGGNISMPFNYTKPTSLSFIMMTATFSISSSTFNPTPVGQTLPLTGTSMTMQMTGPTTAPTTGTGALNVSATDVFGRNVGTAWMFQ